MTAQERFREDYRAARLGGWHGVPSLKRAEACRRARRRQDGLATSYGMHGGRVWSIRNDAVCAGPYGRLP